MKVRFSNVMTTILALICLAAPLRAQWQPPEDKKLTEKQVQTYVGAMKEIRQMWEEQGKKIDQSATGLGALHTAAQVDDKYKAILAKHNVTEEEWNWIMEQATQAFFIGEIVTAYEEGMAQQRADSDKRGAELRQKLADQEEALKNGKRKLSEDEKKEWAGIYKERRDGALQEAKDYDEAAKEAAKEAAEYEKEALAADKNMKSPPKDVEDRAAYIEEQKVNMESNRDLAKEARTRETESKKAADEARKRAEQLAKQVEDPALIVDPDELKSLKDGLTSDIESTKREIAMQEQNKAMTQQIVAQQEEGMKTMRGEIPQENIDLVKKYRKEFQAAWGTEEKKNEQNKAQ